MIATSGIVRLRFDDPRIAQLRQANFGKRVPSVGTNLCDWYGVEVNDALVCAYGVRKDDNGDTWLLEMYVASTFGGKRAARTAALHLINELGVDRGFSDRDNPNFKTWIRFAKRFGFTPVGVIMQRKA